MFQLKKDLIQQTFYIKFRINFYFSEVGSS